MNNADGGVAMTDDAQRLLAFTVRGDRYALDLRDIAEVLDAPTPFPVPWATGALKGAINFHGNLVTLFDLAEFTTPGTAGTGNIALVLDGRIGNLALVADSVENIIPADAVLEIEESNEPHVDRIYVMADGELKLLAPAPLLERIEASLRG